MIGKCLRRRTRAAFAPVNHQEVRRTVQAATQNGAQFFGKVTATDGSLDADRFAGQFTQMHDLIEQLIDIGNIGMPVRAD